MHVQVPDTCAGGEAFVFILILISLTSYSSSLHLQHHTLCLQYQNKLIYVLGLPIEPLGLPSSFNAPISHSSPVWAEVIADDKVIWIESLQKLAHIGNVHQQWIQTPGGCLLSFSESYNILDFVLVNSFSLQFYHKYLCLQMCVFLLSFLYSENHTESVVCLFLTRSLALGRFIHASADGCKALKK